MTVRTEQRRPHPGSADVRNDTPRVSPAADSRPRSTPLLAEPLTAAEVAEALHDRLAVAVVYRDDEGRVRRGLRRTVAAAEKFAARCEDAGRPCQVVLLRTVPMVTTTAYSRIREVRRDDDGRLVSNEAGDC